MLEHHRGACLHCRTMGRACSIVLVRRPLFLETLVVKGASSSFLRLCGVREGERRERINSALHRATRRVDIYDDGVHDFRKWGRS